MQKTLSPDVSLEGQHSIAVPAEERRCLMLREHGPKEDIRKLSISYPKDHILVMYSLGAKYECATS